MEKETPSKKVPSLRKDFAKKADRWTIHRFLEGRSEKQKDQILEMLHRAGVEEDDPMALYLVVSIDCKLAVDPLPEALEQFHSDLEGFKATAYAMQTEINRVTNSLKERALPNRQTSDSLIPFWLLAKVGGLSFGAGVLITIFLLIALSFIKDRPLPPTSMQSTSEVLQHGLN